MKNTLRRLLDGILSRGMVFKWWLRLTGSFRPNRRDGTAAFPFVKKQIETKYLILTYHRVNDDHHPIFPGIPIKDFRIQMEIFRRYFAVLPLEELFLRAKDNDLPPNPVAVTFDDGYRDNYEHAYPILCQLGVPATIFLATEAVDGNKMIWHDRVFEMFRCTQVSSFSYNGQELFSRTPSERKAAFYQCLKDLRRLEPSQRDSQVEALRRLLMLEDLPGRGSEKLTWEHVRTMAEGPVTFGAHTVTHPILSRVSTDVARREIAESKETIELKLGEPVRLFAYPNGGREDFTDATKEMVADAGFVCAVTTIPGANDTSRDPFELRRVGMWGEQHHLMAARLAGHRFA